MAHEKWQPKRISTMPEDEEMADLRSRIAGLEGALREAVNTSCSCGGGEPGHCCQACEVWHRVRAALGEEQKA